MTWENVLGFVIVMGAIIGYGVYVDLPTPDNPWEEDPITVNITGEDSHEYVEELNTTLDYWMNHDERYGNYTANWTYTTGNADVTVEIKDEIESCGLNVAVFSEFTGCSEIITTEHDPEHVTVKISTKSDNITRTMMHEWGHLYGLNHSQEPQPLMDGTVGS